MGASKGQAKRAQARSDISARSYSFADPDQISLFDEIHSEAEERWVTIGMDYNGNILVVVHTYSEVGIDEVRLRIISARKATTQESLAYEQPH